jgi:hypothetical protein
MLFASDALGLGVSIDVSPSTLNLGSSGTPITCTVNLPKPYVAGDVVSVILEGVSPYSSTGGGGTLTCKFDRATFEVMLAPFAPGEVELTLIGLFTDGIEFEDEEEVEERILNNNMDPDELDKAMVLVEQVGFGPGPDNAVMGIRSQKDLDPTSPNYGRLVNASAKGIFVKTDVDKILIRFKYLFLTSEPGGD